MDADLRRTAARIPFLAPLAAEDLDRLLGYSVVRPVDGGTVLFQAGDPADAFFLVLDGQVGLCTPGSTPEILEAGDVVGVEALFERGSRATTAGALGPATVLEVPAEPLFAHLDARFEAVLALLAGASAGLRGMIHEITELKLRSTTHRLASYLVGLVGPDEGEAVARIVLPCEKSQLAERLGMKPESLSRAFAKLRVYGVHSSRTGAVALKDLAALRRLCGGGIDANEEGEWQ